jgi:cobalt-zinc-cadmium efflux system membrane fusion protein
MTTQNAASRTTSAFVWPVLILSLCVGASGAGCNSDTRDGSDRGIPNGIEKVDAKKKPDKSNFVSLTAAEIEEFELQIAPAGAAIIARNVALPGVVRANEDRLAHIVPRFAGIVTEVRKHIGDTVKNGETLAVIESSQSLSPYSLKTLLDGVIIEKHVTRGEAVTPNSQAFVVADLNTVWIDLSVYQRDLTRIREGQPARIIAGHGLPESKGVVSYVTPVVDEGTRTATARIVLDNPDGFWRPGMFASAEITIEQAEVAIAVPTSALHSLNGETVVFVQESAGFRTRPVTIGMRDPQWAEIHRGLDPGERIVVQGGFTVKSELQSGELSGGHGH